LLQLLDPALDIMKEGEKLLDLCHMRAVTFIYSTQSFNRLCDRLFTDLKLGNGIVQRKIAFACRLMKPA
jgi:hypothetical protein